jgi:Protein of unknown function DUF72
VNGGSLEVPIGPSGVRHGFAILSRVNHSPILLGTSSFTATGWQGSFYPKGLRPTDYLSYYAQHFDTVEIDSTFYATPPGDLSEWVSLLKKIQERRIITLPQ